jgi:hypothetical protein
MEGNIFTRAEGEFSQAHGKFENITKVVGITTNSDISETGLFSRSTQHAAEMFCKSQSRKRNLGSYRSMSAKFDSKSLGMSNHLNPDEAEENHFSDHRDVRE